MGENNQPSPLVDYNLFTSDPVLAAAVDRYDASCADASLQEFGRVLGTEQTIRLGFEANEHMPVLRASSQVEFHPSWHELMRLSVEYGLHALPWQSDRPASHVARAALLFLAGQNEAGHTCPISMTCSSMPALRNEPRVANEWEPRVKSSVYDPRFRPAAEKAGVLIGMSMTEQQGGSDVRTNVTRAEPIGADEYLITGAKWFCSAPMNDAFLILAQAPGGLTCFLLPRWTPDGRVNGFHIQRLKPKLGNRSNASAEVEFDRAWAHRIGPEGRGVRTIMEMVQHTRLDCTIGSAAIMRQAVVQAMHHARHRVAFGKLLIDQPLMRSVLDDLSLESHAATLLMMRVAHAFDAKDSDPVEQAFARLATPVAKYWVCKRAPAVTLEAMECLGGNGYVDDCIMPRLYREAPVNSIWEGCGNVICLDVLRAMKKDPAIAKVALDEARLARGADRRFDAFVNALEADLPQADESSARYIAGRLALALQGSLIIRYAGDSATDAFCATRLSGAGHLFGGLPETRRVSCGVPESVASR